MAVVTFRPFRALMTSVVIVFLFCTVLIMITLNNHERNAATYRRPVEMTQPHPSMVERWNEMQGLQDAIADDVKVVPVLKDNIALEGEVQQQKERQGKCTLF
jgi:hypothetical protein